MKHYEVEYTTNMDDRHTATVTGKNLTEAYVSFVVSKPKGYIITDMKEIENV